MPHLITTYLCSLPVHSTQCLERHLKNFFNLQQYPPVHEKNKKKQPQVSEHPCVHLSLKFKNNITISHTKLLLGKMLFYRESVIWLFCINECLLHVSLDKAKIHPADAHESSSKVRKRQGETFKNTNADGLFLTSLFPPLPSLSTMWSKITPCIF